MKINQIPNMMLALLIVSNDITTGDLLRISVINELQYFKMDCDIEMHNCPFSENINGSN